jgi:periplasmic protein TonB
VSVVPNSSRLWPDATRWGLAFAFALSFHAAGAAAMLARWNDDSDSVANAPVIMLELSPVPVAPAIVPTELAPGPQQTEAKPEPEPQRPVEKTEIQAEPAKDADLTVTPLPKPVEKPLEKKPKQKHASLASAPSTADQKADRAAAPSPGAHSRNPNALPSWKSLLVSHLERYKQYPSEAQARGDHGVAQLAFSVDRSGGVHHAHIQRSSGSNALDAATLALIARAAPLPPPPPEVAGAQIAIVVPIRYNIR